MNIAQLKARPAAELLELTGPRDTGAGLDASARDQPAAGSQGRAREPRVWVMARQNAREASCMHASAQELNALLQNGCGSEGEGGEGGEGYSCAPRLVFMDFAALR